MKLKEKKIYEASVQRNVPIGLRGNFDVEFETNKKINPKILKVAQSQQNYLTKQNLGINKLDLGGKYGNIISFTDETNWHLELFCRVLSKLNPHEPKIKKPNLISKILELNLLSHLTVSNVTPRDMNEDVKLHSYFETAKIHLTRIIPMSNDQFFEFFIPKETFHKLHICRLLNLFIVAPILLTKDEILELIYFFDVEKGEERGFYLDSMVKNNTIYKEEFNQLVLILENRIFDPHLNKIVLKCAKSLTNYFDKAINEARQEYKSIRDQSLRTRKAFKKVFGTNQALKNLYTESLMLTSDLFNKDVLRETFIRMETLKEIRSSFGKISDNKQV